MINGLLQSKKNNHLEPQQCFLLGWLILNCQQDAHINVELAAKYYERAADAGHVQAIFNLAKMYEHGIGVGKNSHQEHTLLQEAAKQGYNKAWASLGWLYEHDVLFFDEKKAEECYRKACELGHAPSSTSLAYFYLKHSLDDKLFEILDHLKKAEKCGHAGASYIIGLMYEHGKGTKPQLDQAIEYYELAAKSLHQPAIKKLLAIYSEQGLSPHHEKFLKYRKIYLSKSSQDAPRQSLDPLENMRRLQAHICIGGYEFLDTRNFIAAVFRNSAIRDKEALAWKEHLHLPFPEHLEYAGDRLLGRVVARELPQLFPEKPRGLFAPYYEKFTRNADTVHKHGSALYRVAKALRIKSLLIMSNDDPLHFIQKRGPHKAKKTLECQLANHIEMLIDAITRDRTEEDAYNFVLQYWKKMGLNAEELSDEEFGCSSSEEETTSMTF